MKGTVELMMALIRRAIDEQYTLDMASIDTSEGALEELYKLSCMHDTCHLVACALEKAGKLPHSAAGEKLRRHMILAAYRYEGQNYELSRVCAALESAGICHVPLKGSVLREQYPEPWMRTMSDLDVLVKREDLEAAGRVLTEQLDYTLRESGSHDMSFNSAGGVNVELHYRLGDEETAMAIGQKATRLLDGAWDFARKTEGSDYRYTLNDEFFYFYHIAHTAKHVMNGGCGVKPFIDLYYLDRKSDIDAQKRTALIGEAGLSTFVECLERLLDVWFEGGERDPMISDFESYVITGGVYGTTQNKLTVEQGRRKGKFAYVWMRIFLPYDYLKYYYPILQKHRWLTPFCEVARWFGIVFGGGFYKAKRVFKISSDISPEQAAKTTNLMRDIGLM